MKIEKKITSISLDVSNSCQKKLNFSKNDEINTETINFVN